MRAKGHVFKYGDNVDTDVIIPARYLNSFDAQELASHAMADIDPEFVNKVEKGDLIVANKNFGCGSSIFKYMSFCSHALSLIHIFNPFHKGFSKRKIGG